MNAHKNTRRLNRWFSPWAARPLRCHLWWTTWIKVTSLESMCNDGDSPRGWAVRLVPTSGGTLFLPCLLPCKPKIWIVLSLVYIVVCLSLLCLCGCCFFSRAWKDEYCDKSYLCETLNFSFMLTLCHWAFDQHWVSDGVVLDYNLLISASNILLLKWWWTVLSIIQSSSTKMI